MSLGELDIFYVCPTLIAQPHGKVDLDGRPRDVGVYEGSGRFVTTNSLPDVSLRAVRYGVFSLRGTFVTKTFDTEQVSLHNAFVTRNFVVHMASFSPTVLPLWEVLLVFRSQLPQVLLG